MALITGQAAAGTAATLLFTLPPGPYNVALSADSANTVTTWVGCGTAVTAGNGVPLPAGAVLSWSGYQSSLGSPVHVITASSAATLGWVISTPD